MGRPERIAYLYDHRMAFLAMTFLGGNDLRQQIYRFLDRRFPDASRGGTPRSTWSARRLTDGRRAPPCESKGSRAAFWTAALDAGRRFAHRVRHVLCRVYSSASSQLVPLRLQLPDRWRMRRNSMATSAPWRRR